MQKTLDLGAAAVICPMVNTVEDARALVECAKYPPVGSRSFGPILHDVRDAETFLAGENERSVIFGQCETAQSVENLREILSVDGFDGVYVGPCDLAISMGMPPQSVPRDRAVSMPAPVSGPGSADDCDRSAVPSSLPVVPLRRRASYR